MSGVMLSTPIVKLGLKQQQPIAPNSNVGDDPTDSKDLPSNLPPITEKKMKFHLFNSCCSEVGVIDKTQVSKHILNSSKEPVVDVPGLEPFELIIDRNQDPLPEIGSERKRFEEVDSTASCTSREPSVQEMDPSVAFYRFDLADSQNLSGFLEISQDLEGFFDENENLIENEEDKTSRAGHSTVRKNSENSTQLIKLEYPITPREEEDDHNDLGIPTLDKFEIIDDIKEGCFGHVWTATGAESKKRPAPKYELVASSLDLDISAEELDTWQNIRHYIFTRCFGFVQKEKNRDDVMYPTAMECFDNILVFDSVGSRYYTLPYWPEEDGTIKDPILWPESKVSYMGHQMLTAMRYLHDRDLILGGLTPDILTLETRTYTIRIKEPMLSTYLIRTGKWEIPIDWARFMAPEALLGIIDPTMDIWSLGAMVYYLLFGETPLMGTLEQVQDRVRLKRSFIDIPEWVNDLGISSKALVVLRRCLTWRSRERPHSWILDNTFNWFSSKRKFDLGNYDEIAELLSKRSSQLSCNSRVEPTPPAQEEMIPNNKKEDLKEGSIVKKNKRLSNFFKKTF